MGRKALLTGLSNFLFALLVLQTHTCYSASTVTGKVTDTTGEPVSGAIVSFTDESDPGIKLSVTTDTNGRYEIVFGTYVNELIPRSFTLLQNYPNPFNPTTTIPFSLDKTGFVILSIYNVLGQEIRTLISGQRSAGQYSVTWDGFDDEGKSIGAGIYIYSLRCGSQVDSKKMLLLDGSSPGFSNGNSYMNSSPPAKIAAGNQFRVTISGEGIVTYRKGGILISDGLELDFVVSRFDVDKFERLIASADSVVQEMIEAGEDFSVDDILDYMESASDIYKEAAAVNPANGKANFGAALFGFQALLDNPDLTMIRDTLESWERNEDSINHAQYYITQVYMHGEDEFLLNKNGWEYYECYEIDKAFFALFYFVENSLSNQNVLELLQDTIDNTLIARLDEAIGYMDKVLDDEDFTYLITEEMTGDDEEFEIDLGEAYVISALMRIMRASLRIMNSYCFSLPEASGISDYIDVTNVFPALKAQDEGNGDFLKLRNSTYLPAAKQDLLKALAMVQNGVDYIQSETDSQLNDLIKRDELDEGDEEINSGFADYDDIPVPVLRGATGIVDLADKIKSMIEEPFDVEIDTDNGKETVSIDLSAFLSNGIPDIKQVLPYRKWKNLNSFDKGFGGPGIESWGEVKLDDKTYREIHIDLLWDYEDAVGSDVAEYYEFLGSISEEGVVTIEKTRESNNGYVDVSDDMQFTTDGAIYLNSQKQLCLTQEAYNLMNSWVSEAERESWAAYLLADYTSDLPTDNFSVDHPFGVRESSGVFKFAGTPEYVDDFEPVNLLDGPGGNILKDDAFPVFPDPTFGGVLPGMTQERLESIIEE